MVAESLRCPSTCSWTSASAQPKTKKSSSPTEKNSNPLSPLVVLAFEWLRLVLRRKPDPLLHLSTFLSLQICDRTSSCCVACACRSASVARASAFYTLSFHSSCQQGSAACPFFSSFSTSRADHGTFARQTTEHQSLYRGSATIGEFKNLKCCGSCDVLFPGTHTTE